MLVIFVIRLVRLLSRFNAGSRPNIDDLKEKANNLKNKYKDLEEADFRDIPSDDENKSSKENNA
jgi:hypothetical protein